MAINGRLSKGGESISGGEEAIYEDKRQSRNLGFVQKKRPYIYLEMKGCMLPAR